MTSPADLSLFVQRKPDGVAQLDLVVEGLETPQCMVTIEKTIGAEPAVLRARINYSNRRLTIEWRDGALDPALLVQSLESLGYPAHPFQSNQSEDSETRVAHYLLRCLGVAGFASMNIMLLSVSVWSGHVSGMNVETRDLLYWMSALIVLPSAAYAGRPFFASAWRALKSGGVNMDVPISLGIFLALTMSLVETWNHAEHAYFDSAIMLIFFLLTGRYLDHAMRRKTRAVAANLAALRAVSANRINANGEVICVPAESLVANDVILLRPGERVPADTVVLSGHSEVDDSLVTGETHRRVVGEGDLIHAGAINFNGALRLRVLKGSSQSLVDEIERMIEAALTTKNAYLRLGDRAARLYAPVVHVTALATAIGWYMAGASAHDAIITAIAVLIITCPCALALAVPAVQVVASGALFRRGVLLSSGDAIERLSEVDTVVFDKTGTLTLPQPILVNRDEIAPEIVERAARLSLSSHHPLARALDGLAQLREAFDQVEEVAGAGVMTRLQGLEMRLGSTEFCSAQRAAEAALAADPDASLICFRHGEMVAVFRIRQSLRPDAVETVRGMKALGLDCLILSGDRATSVEPVAQSLQIDDWRAAMKPADKIAVLDDMKSRGKRVLMVGDGINDAPALASAHVSLSPMTGSDLAQASSDAVFMGEKLSPILMAVTISRHARALMRQNLWLAVIYNLFAVPLAIAGYVTPLVAAAAMSGSSILVTLNALRGNQTKESK
jgi:Cu2+-exporting ATPase